MLFTRLHALTLCLFCLVAGGMVRSQNTSSPVRDTEKRIRPQILGREAPVGRFPYMCSLRMRGDRKHKCGGVVIHRRWVLTAAHCIDPDFDGSVGLQPLIYCGIHGIDDYVPEMTFTAIESVVHPRWNGKVEKGFDIAVLKLNRKADSSIPEILAKKNALKSGSRLSALGWGRTEISYYSEKLHMTDLPFVPPHICRNNGYSIDDDRMVCAGLSQANTCEGDSGGPLLLPDAPKGEFKAGLPQLDLLVGITSYGLGSCTDEDFTMGIYTRVGHYSEWIQCIISSGVNQRNQTETDTPDDDDDDDEMTLAVAPEDENSCPPCGPEFDFDEDCVDLIIEPNSGPEGMVPTEGPSAPPPGSAQAPRSGPCTNPPELKDVVAEIKNDDAAAVQTALDCGLDPDSRYSETFAWADRPLLHWAVRYDSPDSAKVLVESGADVKGKNSRNTHLHYCSTVGSISVAKVLISSGADVNAKGIGEDSPLHDAASNGHADVAKLLLDSGADVDARDDHGETPLHAAATEDHPEIIRILVDAGANIDAKDDDSETPLHEASKEGNNRVVEELIEEGADMEAKEKDGHTALHLAAIRDHADTAKILVDAGADVDATDYSGETPLHEAAERGHLVVVRVLVDAGGSKTIRDLSGNRPVDVVCDPTFSQCSRNTRLVIKDLLAP